ncbi:MAG: inositol monophosphatase family protein [Pseudoruegeria sp.]
MNKGKGLRLHLAKDIAVEAGHLAIEMRLTADKGFAKEKGHQDFVTAADLAVETLIRARIASVFPEDSVLGEENGTTGTGDALWVIDPIDGTTNYMHGLADWAVSIAFCIGGKIEYAAIFAPDIDTLVWARSGKGAFVWDEPINVSICDTAANALVLLGRSARCKTDGYLQMLNRIFEKGLEYRRNGSAAFSLSMVALGRADAFYEAHLNPWDAMAGILIAQEAGGNVEHPPYSEFINVGGAVFVSNNRIHSDVKSAING